MGVARGLGRSIRKGHEDLHHVRPRLLLHLAPIRLNRREAQEYASADRHVKVPFVTAFFSSFGLNARSHPQEDAFPMQGPYQHQIQQDDSDCVGQ